METRNGIKVKHLKFIPETKTYVGIVKGKAFMWDKNGHHATKRRSKFDLVLTYYFNVTRWGGRVRVHNKSFKSLEEAVANKPKGYLKTIDCVL